MFSLLLLLLAAGPEAPDPGSAPAVAATATPIPLAERNPLWAVKIEEKGLPNLHKVTEGLYRGAQPTREGFQALEKRGVKTVVNLRLLHTDKLKLRNTKLQYEHVNVEAWLAKDKEVLRFLRVATDPERGAVFVHCQHGADRTGTMIAAYRVVVQGWTPEDAATEMIEGGYNFHAVWSNLVTYVKALDAPKLRKELGIAEPVPAAASPTPSPVPGASPPIQR